MSTNGDSPGDSAPDAAHDPSGFLSEIIGNPVTVKLNSGIVYKGILSTFTLLPAVSPAATNCHVSTFAL